MAPGELLQVVRRGEVESRMVFHFKDGSVLDGTLELPPDVYNGMVLTVAKNLPKGASETVHYVAFTPTPRLIQLELVPEGEHKVLVGELAKTAIRYVCKPRLGTWLKLFTTLLGRTPPDSQAWIVTDVVPTFVRFEGPLYTRGPIWRIEVTSPRWPEQPDTEPGPVRARPARPHAAP